MPIYRLRRDWDPLRDLEREVDQLLRSVTVSMAGGRVGRPFPPVNVYEDGDAFVITAELPGVALADLDVSVVDGTLTLAGKRESTAGVDDARHLRAERYRGSWKRSLPLPERVMPDEMTASFSQGVLRVRLPRAPEVRPRQIRVTPGEEPS